MAKTRKIPLRKSVVSGEIIDKRDLLRIVKTKDGDYVVGSFFEPNDYFTEPYIKISTGDYEDLLNEIGKDNALASFIYTLSHEITHYYQWINRVEKSVDDREIEVDYYGDYILQQYADCVESP